MGRMIADLEEQAVRQQYRIVCDPSWQVQKWHRGQWVTASYCGSEESAARALERHVWRSLAWSKMNDEERIQSILR
jgi:hypothetical protein